MITIPRMEVDNKVISATEVRQLIKSGDLTDLAKLVPVTTEQFIKDNLATLQERIKKGQYIKNGN